MLNNILIFTGAGASVQFNKPATREFRQKLSKKYEGSELMKSFLDCPGFDDIEHVLESLKDFELAHNNHMTHYLKNATLPGIVSNTCDFFTKLTRERDKIRSDIMQDLFQTYKWNEIDNENARKFYRDLFTITSKYSSKIFVGTTNYDQAIEQACALSNLSYECIDGFEHYQNDISKWNGEKFTEEFNGQGMPVYLYKIHGSLNWKYDGTGNIEKNNRDIGYESGSGQNVLIAPTLSPKTAQSKEPFLTLLTELKNKLEKVDACIIIGFSFRDKHIGELFQKFIEKGKNFIVISKSGYVKYCDYLFEQKFSSDEARNAWIRKHRTGKKIFFIPEQVEQDNNRNVFTQLEEILSKISNESKSTKNQEKSNQNLSELTELVSELPPRPFLNISLPESIYHNGDSIKAKISYNGLNIGETIWIGVYDPKNELIDDKRLEVKVDRGEIELGLFVIKNWKRYGKYRIKISTQFGSESYTEFKYQK